MQAIVPPNGDSVNSSAQESKEMRALSTTTTAEFPFKCKVVFLLFLSLSLLKNYTSAMQVLPKLPFKDVLPSTFR